MRLRDLHESDFDEVAGLIHGALATWYRVNLNSERFGEDAGPFRAFPELYEVLDAGCGVVMEGEDGRLAGVVFYHPRETHWGVGIVATHPDFAGRGVARRLMEEVIGRAGGMPLRLVSSAMNLDSFSLYTRMGFVPRRVYQDMVMQVSAAGMGELAHGLRIRRAEMDDVERLADLEMRLSGIRRERDLRHLIGNAEGVWRMWLAEGEDGRLLGFLGAVMHAGVRMIGPGVAVDEEAGGVLLHAVLDAEFRGQEALWLVPADCAGLVRRCYAWGARNVELHLGSVRGECAPMVGVTFPTFMPESG